VKLRDFVRNWSEAVRPGLAVFPEIDVGGLARRLNLERRGRDRGRADQPATESAALDSVELEIVSEVDRLRRQGLNAYAEHLDTYARRLREAEAASTLADLREAAQTAISDFKVLCGNARNALTNANDHLTLCRRERTAFTRRHGTDRPARPRAGWTGTISLALILLAVESAGNSYFFAAGNELGLLGGWFVAILISVANVGFASVAGYFARYVNHRSLLGKLAGFLMTLPFMAAILMLNVGVAQFRDALAGLPWQEASAAALVRMQTAPFALASVESWLLVGIGMLIVLVAWWKGYAFDDPYPGYGGISRRLAEARDAYAEEWRDWTGNLTDLRDQSIEELRMARSLVAETLRDGPNILASRAGLTGQRDVFLDHCDTAANRLLAVYREANRAARKSPQPPRFDERFRFDPVAAVDQAPADQARTEEAGRAIEQVVQESMATIKEAHDGALAGLPLIEDIEREERHGEARV
jgi:hypothetical protein